MIKTKLDSKRMERVRRMFGYGSGIDVRANGLRRGLAHIWKENVIIDLRSFSTHHIDVVVTETDGAYR